MLEHALWIPWFCKGSALAISDTTLVQIEARHFGDLVREDNALWMIMAEYVDNFVAWINKQDMKNFSDVTAPTPLFLLPLAHVIHASHSCRSRR